MTKREPGVTRTQPILVEASADVGRKKTLRTKRSVSARLSSYDSFSDASRTKSIVRSLIVSTQINTRMST